MRSIRAFIIATLASVTVSVLIVNFWNIAHQHGEFYSSIDPGRIVRWSAIYDLNMFFKSLQFALYFAVPYQATMGLLAIWFAAIFPRARLTLYVLSGLYPMIVIQALWAIFMIIDAFIDVHEIPNYISFWSEYFGNWLIWLMFVLPSFTWGILYWHIVFRHADGTGPSSPAFAKLNSP